MFLEQTMMFRSTSCSDKSKLKIEIERKWVKKWFKNHFSLILPEELIYESLEYTQNKHEESHRFFMLIPFKLDNAIHHASSKLKSIVRYELEAPLELRTHFSVG